jgi:hypothetical protein
MAALLGGGVPVFDIRLGAGETDMLIRTPALGCAHADCLGLGPATLMRGHGAAVTGNSLQQVVYRSIYMEMNARLQAEALRLGPVTYLTETEAALAAATNDGQVHRPWELWARSDRPRLREEHMSSTTNGVKRRGLFTTIAAGGAAALAPLPKPAPGPTQTQRHHTRRRRTSRSPRAAPAPTT